MSHCAGWCTTAKIHPCTGEGGSPRPGAKRTRTAKNTTARCRSVDRKQKKAETRGRLMEHEREHGCPTAGLLIESPRPPQQATRLNFMYCQFSCLDNGKNRNRGQPIPSSPAPPPARHCTPTFSFSFVCPDVNKGDLSNSEYSAVPSPSAVPSHILGGNFALLSSRWVSPSHNSFFVASQLKQAFLSKELEQRRRFDWGQSIPSPRVFRREERSVESETSSCVRPTKNLFFSSLTELPGHSLPSPLPPPEERTERKIRTTRRHGARLLFTAAATWCAFPFLPWQSPPPRRAPRRLPFFASCPRPCSRLRRSQLRCCWSCCCCRCCCA